MAPGSMSSLPTACTVACKATGSIGLRFAAEAAEPPAQQAMATAMPSMRVVMISFPRHADERIGLCHRRLALVQEFSVPIVAPSAR